MPLGACSISAGVNHLLCLPALLLAGCLANPQRHQQARCDSCNPPACFYITQAARQHQRCCSIAQPALVNGVLRLLNQGKLITGHGNNSSSCVVQVHVGYAATVEWPRPARTRVHDAHLKLELSASSRAKDLCARSRTAI